MTAVGRAALDAMITQQVQIIPYIDDYKLLLMIATLAVLLLIVFTKAPCSSPDCTLADTAHAPSRECDGLVGWRADNRSVGGLLADLSVMQRRPD